MKSKSKSTKAHSKSSCSHQTRERDEVPKAHDISRIERQRKSLIRM
ncbi:hypothetical protein KP509_05G060300 [Ceratopteris richardii]|uniref:Uncharacterized protein n=1 Tax=Ceratopteris richardii TaxID=49495 RepID=A0A8T2UUV0_CERRI|nr:hypothetical protein KP509_05G060300 [Ceratopteris richardii]